MNINYLFIKSEYFFYRSISWNLHKDVLFNNHSNKQNSILNFFQVNFGYEKFNYCCKKYLRKSKKFFYVLNDFECIWFTLNILTKKFYAYFFLIIYEKKKFLVMKNWLSDFKKINFFLKKKQKHVHLVKKKTFYVFFYILHQKITTIKKNANKIVKINSKFFYNICKKKTNQCYCFLKNNITNRTETSKTTRDTLNKVSPSNLISFISKLSVIRGEIFLMGKFFFETIEKNKKDFFYFIFYANIFYIVFKESSCNSCIYFFSLLCLNFQQKNRFEQFNIQRKNYAREYRKDFFFIKKKSKFDKKELFLLKKNYISSKINFFLINIIDNLIFSYLISFMLKFALLLLKKNTKILSSFLIEINDKVSTRRKKNNYSEKKYTRTSSIVYKKVKKVKKKQITMKIKFVSICILKNLFKFTHSVRKISKTHTT